MAVIPTPASGEIDAIDINRALDRADTTTMSMNGSAERALAEVPSGIIRFSDFYDKPSSTAEASLSDRTVSSTSISPGSASTLYRINNNGNVYGPTSANVLEVWKDLGANSDFDVRATHVSGVIPAGTYNTWLNLGTSRDWTMGRSGIGTSSGVVDFEIRESASGTILTTARITLSAQVIDLN